MIQLCVQCPGNDMYVSLWQILMTWWTKDFSDIIFPMDNIICNVLFFGEDLSKIPMNKRRSFLTFGNAKLEPHTVHMLLSYYQDSSPISLGCRSMLLRQPKLEEKMLSICHSSMLSAVSSMLTAAACCAERTKTWRKMTIINFIFPSETASISLATMLSISLVPVVWTLWRSTSKTT